MTDYPFDSQVFPLEVFPGKDWPEYATSIAEEVLMFALIWRDDLYWQMQQRKTEMETLMLPPVVWPDIKESWPTIQAGVELVKLSAIWPDEHWHNSSEGDAL